MFYQRIGIISDGRLVRLAVGLYSFSKFIELSHINSFEETDLDLKKIRAIKDGFDRLIRDLNNQIQAEYELKNSPKPVKSPKESGVKKA